MLDSIRLTALLTLCAAAANADDPNPVYVSESGADTGACAVSACRSIDYALSQAGKGGEIRLGVGRFELSDPNTLFSIIAGQVPISGGYDLATGKQTGETTTLTGVPAEFRETLSAMGFHVVSDTKARSDAALQTQKMLSERARLRKGLAAAPCTSGQVNGLDCSNIDLVAHVPLGSVSATPRAGADIWGFVDLNTDREYVIISYDIGAAVFDVSDSENPVEIGFVDGQPTVWRDVKVYQRYDATAGRFIAYAYVTTDGVGDGLFVIDLSELPHRIRRVEFASDFAQSHNVFSLNTDYATGLPLVEKTPALIIAGASTGTGRLRSYSLANAEAPSLAAAPGLSGCGVRGCYMHDAASMIIRDSRTSQCPNATDHCEVLFDFNEDTFDLWDVTDPSSPVRLSRTPYSFSSYTHSGWATEDGMVVFVQDELDERNGRVSRTTLRSFDISDLTSPTALAGWQSDTTAIDHNGFVRGNRYYMSHYTDGLTILDITNAATPMRVGFLDTYPFTAGSVFNGAWGAYPFFPSGLIGVSDIDSGLYLIRDESLAVQFGTLSFSGNSFAVEESSSSALTVTRVGGSTGAVSVDYEILAASGDGADVDIARGTLSWADGDGADKTIAVTATGDTEAEGLERLFVRLQNPQGGATLSAPAMANLFVGDAGATASLGFADTGVNVAERLPFGAAAAIVQRSGSALGSVSVDFTVTGLTADAGTDFSGNLSGTLTWPDGDATPRVIVVDVADDGAAENDETFEVTLSNPIGAGLGSNSVYSVTIEDGDGANAAPVANAGSSQTVSSGAAVTLSGSASTDPDGDSLSYAWTQTLGPSVSINGAASETAAFTAPTVSADTLLQFQLTVTDPRGASDQASVSITVTAPTQSTGGGGGGGGGGWALFVILLLGAAGFRRRIARLAGKR